MSWFNPISWFDELICNCHGPSVFGIEMTESWMIYLALALTAFIVWKLRGVGRG